MALLSPRFHLFHPSAPTRIQGGCCTRHQWKATNHFHSSFAGFVDVTTLDLGKFVGKYRGKFVMISGLGPWVCGSFPKMKLWQMKVTGFGIPYERCR